MSSVQQLWMESHPYLQKVAEFQQAVAKAFAEPTPNSVSMPDWSRCVEEYRDGVPLLENSAAALNHTIVAEEILLAGTTRLLKETLPEPLAQTAAKLQEYLQASEDNRKTAITWVQDGGPGQPPQEVVGLLQALGWTAITRALAPVLSSYAEWRNEDNWMRGYCPVCGSLPTLAQLAPGGQQPRLLACGCCHSTWQYRRIGCPFCENEDPTQLAIFTIEQEPLFRLDTCHECNGYLKTYLGESDVDLYLSDWASLHLDVVAKQQGLERKGSSLFEILT